MKYHLAITRYPKLPGISVKINRRELKFKIATGNNQWYIIKVTIQFLSNTTVQSLAKTNTSRIIIKLVNYLFSSIRAKRFFPKSISDLNRSNSKSLVEKNHLLFRCSRCTQRKLLTNKIRCHFHRQVFEDEWEV